MRMLDLFSGIGGISLAADWAGIETVAFCEIEPFPQKVLRKNWPDVPIFEDVTKLSKQTLTEAGVIDDVLADLESEGYQARAFVLPTAAVQAPHRRDRVFVVAYSDSIRNNSEKQCGINREWTKKMQEREQSQYRFGNDSKTLAHTSGTGWEEQYTSSKSNRSGYSSGSINERGATRTTQSGMGGVLDGLSDWLDGYKWPAGYGQEQYGWEPPRVAVGVKDRVGRLKGLGNAVVPHQIYPIFAAIVAIES